MAYFKGTPTRTRKSSRTNRRRDTKTQRAQLRRRAEYREQLQRHREKKGAQP